MRRVVFIIFAIIALVACSQSEVEIVGSVECDNTSSNLTLNVGFEVADTRIHIDEVGKSVWDTSDLVSVFYNSDENQQWIFQGVTGDRVGTIAPMGPVKVPTIDGNIVVLYPYNDCYVYNSDNTIKSVVGSEQQYAVASYGANGNIMVAQSQNSNLTLKNVYGWIKISLTGDTQAVKSIKLMGNNNEQLAGEVVINAEDATAEFTHTDNPIRSLTLSSKAGVRLHVDSPTSFYIGVMPQRFANGITIEIENILGQKMTKSTSKEVVISRSTIQPMSPFEFVPEKVKEYSLGEVVEVNGVKGMVFAIKDFPVYNAEYTEVIRTDKYCYLVSLDEEDLQWSLKYEWCNCMSKRGDYNSSDPFRYYGMDINDYPAFKWCMEHGAGWFLPSSTEMNWMWEMLTEGVRDFSAPSVAKYNTLIEKSGGEPFVETFYWSSNEISEQYIEVVAFMNESIVCLEPSKDKMFTARAAYRFKIR